MKQRIFSKGKGWYISASNYKNRDDKAYMNVHFTKDCGEPPYRPTADSDFVFTDIDILEQAYGAFNGKMTLTVFKYNPIENDGKLTEVDRQENAVQSVSLSPDDLPFY